MMRESLEALLKDAMVNNTYDTGTVEKMLRGTLDHSFSYLYRLQRSLIEFREFHFTAKQIPGQLSSGDMYTDKSGRLCITVDYDLIDRYAREKYRTSDYFDAEFTQDDIMSNQDMFTRFPLLMIDHQAIFDFQIRMDNGMTTLILPFNGSYIYTKDWDFIDHDICVYIIPNIFMATYTTNRAAMKKQSPSGDDVTYILSSVIKNTRPTKGGIYFTFVQIADDTYSAGLYETTEEDGYFHFDFDETIQAKILDNSGTVTLRIIFFENLYKHTMYTGNDYTSLRYPPDGDELESEFLVIQKDELDHYAMPVPTEDIMVLKYVSDETDDAYDRWVPMSGISTELYYPNIYRIKDSCAVEGYKYKVYYFYQKNYVLEYMHLFEFYHWYLTNKFGVNLEQIINELYFEDVVPATTDDIEFMTIFKKVLDYDWYNHKYDLIEYVTEYNEEMAPTEYKVSKMWEFLKDDPDLLRKYVRKQNIISDCYYVYVADIDLSLRERYTTANDTIHEINFAEDDPRYVFAFRNKEESVDFQCRMYIDGNLCMDYTHVQDDGSEFFYIPTSLINEDSYIEVEVLHPCNYSMDMRFGSTDEYYEMIIDEQTTKVNPTLQDITITDDSGNEYDLDKFSIYRVCNTEGEELDCPIYDENGDMIVNFSRATHLKVYPKDSSMFDKNLTLTIKKNPIYFNWRVNRTSYPIISLAKYPVKQIEDYIRVFYEGRLIPRSQYRIYEDFDDYRIQILFEMHDGDNVGVEITPFRYNLIYYAEEIENYTEEPFIVDLTGKINKPFDPRYFDIYSNGRKLSIVNCHLISPTKVAFTNLTSSHILEIYEKDRDWEYFGLDYDTFKFYFTPDQLIEDDFMDTEEVKKLVDWIIEKTKDNSAVVKLNTDTEDDVDVLLWDDRHLDINIFYYEELLPKRLADPDRVQFNKEYLQTIYPTIANTYLVDANNSGVTSLDQYDVLMLDPDVTMEGTDEGIAVLVAGDYDDIMED